MASTHASTAVKGGAVTPRPCPFTTFLRELGELRAAVEVPTMRVWEPPPGMAMTLEGAVALAAQKLQHDTFRTVLVLRSPTADLSAACEVLAVLTSSAAAMVAGTQLLLSGTHMGVTRRRDIVAAVRSIIAALSHMFGAWGAREAGAGDSEGGVGGGGGGGTGDDATDSAAMLTPAAFASRRARHADSLLYHTGILERAVGKVASLPASDFAAVKRQLLSAAKLIKTSVQEIAEDNGIDSTKIAGDAAPYAHLLNDGVGTPAAGAGGGAGTVGDGSGSGAYYLLRAGIAALKSQFKAMRAITEAADAVAETLRETEGSPSTGGAAAALEDAVIDWAAAVNEPDTAAVSPAADACNAAGEALVAALRAHSLPGGGDATGGKVDAGATAAAAAFADARRCMAAAVVAAIALEASGPGGDGGGAHLEGEGGEA